MKKNYRRRKTKSSTPSFVYVVAVFFSILMISGFIRGLTRQNVSEQTKEENQEVTVETIKQALARLERLDKTKDKEYFELLSVKHFTDLCNEGEYIDANGVLFDFKKRYPKSKYIAMIEKEYPDFNNKLEAQREKKKQEEKEAKEKKDAQWELVKKDLYAMEEEIRATDTNGVYVTFEFRAHGGELTIDVNNNWERISDDQKRAFITNVANLYNEMVFPTASKLPQSSQLILFQKHESKAPVATWDPERNADLWDYVEFNPNYYPSYYPSNRPVDFSQVQGIKR